MTVRWSGGRRYAGGSRRLIEQRLCASAHNFAPVRSIYGWRGDIYERTEGRVSLHTRHDRVAEIVALAKKERPYEVPGISTRTITECAALPN